MLSPTVHWVVSILGFLLFGFLHSLLARAQLKQWLFERWPALSAFYRLLYNLLSTLLLGAWYVTFPNTSELLYRLEGLWFYLFRAIQLLGLVGFIASGLQTDGASFLGIRQARDYLRSGDLPGDLDENQSQELIVNGLYRYVRHPLYFFSMAILLFQPVVSVRWAVLSLLFTLYFIIGSRFEERGLIRRFGDAYRRYRDKVPALIPSVPKLIKELKSG